MIDDARGRDDSFTTPAARQVSVPYLITGHPKRTTLARNATKKREKGAKDGGGHGKGWRPLLACPSLLVLWNLPQGTTAGKQTGPTPDRQQGVLHPIGQRYKQASAMTSISKQCFFIHQGPGCHVFQE